LKIGVIVDNMTVPRWAGEALATLRPDATFVVYNCRNTPPSPRRLRHLAYYALNLFTIRNVMTRPTGVGDHVGPADVFDFESELEGLWQRLPDALLDRIEEDRPDAIVKFGMHLLRIPDRSRLSVPILSYHHGDPEHFRGRPAGFHELHQRWPALGQIVQILSNRLDAGEVLAFAETKVLAHSYRRTLIEAYRHSPLLLKVALANLAAGKRLAKLPNGKNYRLPGNATVAAFVLARIVSTVRRLVYGAFYEKQWRVSTAPADPESAAGAFPVPIPPPQAWNIVPLPSGYAFLADPFFGPRGDGLLVEALNGATDRGEILWLRGDAATRLSDPDHHHSYPATADTDEGCLLIPEMSEKGRQRLYLLSEAGLADLGELAVPGDPRLLDPTLYAVNGRVYLFANRADEGDGVLRLWVAESVRSDFVEHPASPILISPRGARMAGSVLATEEGVFRFGQDLRTRYGDGLVAHRIEELSPSAYREAAVGDYRFSDRRGPHTIQVRDRLIAFDWYRERFHPLAGLRRLRRSKPMA